MANQKKKKLPISLLRIPRDLQIHLFHYLTLEDLTKVQRVCRSLCIVARDPSSLYSLEFSTRCNVAHHFLSECYSKPKMLSVQGYRANPLLICNEKWSRSVIDLSFSFGSSFAELEPPCSVVSDRLLYFQNVVKCSLYGAGNNALKFVRSYSILKELTLNNVLVDEHLVNGITAFSNLEKLKL